MQVSFVRWQIHIPQRKETKSPEINYVRFKDKSSASGRETLHKMEPGHSLTGSGKAPKKCVLFVWQSFLQRVTAVRIIYLAS